MVHYRRHEIGALKNKAGLKENPGRKSRRQVYLISVPVLRAAAALALAACMGFLVVGCARAPRSDPATGFSGRAPQAKLRVAATIYPLAEFSRRVGGARVEVTQLLPPGAEPHHWEPSPKDMIRLYQAQIVVFNGAGLEPWAVRVIPALRARGIRVVEAAQGLDLLTFAEEERLGVIVYPGGFPAPGGLPGHEAHQRGGREGEEAGHAVHSEGVDPHVWLDPLLAREIVSKLAGEFGTADPAGAAGYEERARLLRERLERLHQEYAAAARSFRSRDLVVSHAAFGYLARRYGLRQVPVLGLTPEQEPDAATLRRVADFCRERGVRYIFFESLVSPRVAETVAREVGAETLLLTPVAGLTPEEARSGLDYFALMSRNLANLKKALGG
ncbi:MAG: zinc ABC transporter substrate-binding protein [Bacillota bacterium]|nr:zinc ABC transporter substrate-binding protein [Bacillota bacterium]